MKISEAIAQLAAILAEYGDIEITGTEYAGVKRVPVEKIVYRDYDEFDRPVNSAHVIVKSQ